MRIIRIRVNLNENYSQIGRMHHNDATIQTAYTYCIQSTNK